MPAERRIRVVENTDGYPWMFTAILEARDPSGWYQEDSDDGDTPQGAIGCLRDWNRAARDAAVVGVHDRKGA